MTLSDSVDRIMALHGWQIPGFQDPKDPCYSLDFSLLLTAKGVCSPCRIWSEVS